MQPPKFTDPFETAPEVHDSEHQIPETVEEAEEKMEDEGGGVHPAPAPNAEVSDSSADQFMRLRADFDNYRKRTAREHLLQRQHGRREAIERLLLVFDGLSMGLLKMPKDNPWRAGLEALQTQFLSCFESLGVKRVKTRGQRFDPNLHEAIGNIPSSDYPEGIICEESRAGFIDEVGLLRAAQVLVSNGN